MNITSNPVCGKYVDITATFDNATFSLGLHDDSEREKFAQMLRDAADDIMGWNISKSVPKKY